MKYLWFMVLVIVFFAVVAVFGEVSGWYQIPETFKSLLAAIMATGWFALTAVFAFKDLANPSRVPSSVNVEPSLWLELQ